MKPIWTLLLSLSVLSASGLGASGPAAPSSPLRVLAFREVPFFYDHEGAVKGFEYEILALYARVAGRRIEVVWVERFEDVLPMLAKGLGDVVAARVTITTERRALFGFSAPYFTVRIVLVEPLGKTTTRLDELRGATLATTRGTTYEELLSEIPDVKLVYGDQDTDLLRLVATGKARATAVDSMSVLGLLPKFPQLKISLPLSEPQAYGFAVRKGSQLEGELSRHVELLRTSAMYFRLIEKYFGKDAATMVRAAHR